MGLLYGVALVVLALIAGLIFHPAVKRSIEERKLSIEAFLKIPRDVALDMCAKVGLLMGFCESKMWANTEYFCKS